MKRILFILILIAANPLLAQNYPTETQEVKTIMEASDIHSSFRYCVEGTLTCRTLVILKNKVSGELNSQFYDVFASSERAVGSTGYFIQNEKCEFGIYHNYLDDIFDGKIDINKKFTENSQLVVSFDSHGFPTVHDFQLIRLGTTRYIKANLIYTKKESKISGTELDSADPNYAVPVNIIYKRMK